jgi:hypothetical protein
MAPHYYCTSSIWTTNSQPSDDEISGLESFPPPSCQAKRLRTGEGHRDQTVTLLSLPAALQTRRNLTATSIVISHGTGSGLESCYPREKS